MCSLWILRFSTNTWLYKANDIRQGNSCYGTVIGNHMCSIELWHFRWPWVTFQGDDNDILQIQVYWQTNRKSYGAIFIKTIWVKVIEIFPMTLTQIVSNAHHGPTLNISESVQDSHVVTVKYWFFTRCTYRSNDFTKFSTIRSVARPLCDSWVSCLHLLQ